MFTRVVFVTILAVLTEVPTRSQERFSLFVASSPESVERMLTLAQRRARRSDLSDYFAQTGTALFQQPAQVPGGPAATGHDSSRTGHARHSGPPGD